MLIWCLAYLQRFNVDRRAVTTIEYALIAAVIAVEIVNAMLNLGKHVTTTFNRIASEL
jgi:pilus assembly protein Flp/PilA